MAASTLQLSGLDIRSNSEWLGYQITRPFDIELPRSLVPVVISWNIPIHLWIKTCKFIIFLWHLQFVNKILYFIFIFISALNESIDVFENIKQYGKFKAIFLTYLISSCLHGLNLHLAAVLLSIGIFSFIEFRLRNVMSEILDACINSNKCHVDPKNGVCLTKGHENTSKKYWVKIINLLFGILTVILLAYLGVLLDISSMDNETLNRWSSLNFFGHIIAFIMLIIYLILK